jgi:Zn-dependent M28 family amino/carboxypeptidase
MKKTLLLLVLAIVFACKTSVKEVEPISTTITSEELKEMVTYLASDELKGRNTGTEGIAVAATYIESQLKSYGVKPYFETYRDNFKVETAKDTLDAFNVVAYIEGTDATLKNEFIVIGAHYDHIGQLKAVENDSIANGANDNATGTAGVLAMAKYFAAKKNSKRSLIFALFSAEEMGLRGSKHLAKKLKDENLNLYTMVNFEMIGVPFVGRDYVAFLTGFERSNMAEKLNEYVDSKLIGFSEVSKQYQLFMRSDNYAFFQEFSLPSHTISSCDLTNFDHYHKVGDEAQEMDYDFMAGLINKTIPAIEAMSNTPTKEIKMNDEQKQ